MDQTTSTSSPLPALDHLRQGWRKLAEAVWPGATASAADRATMRVLHELAPLIEECRPVHNGEASARARAERIATIYRRADAAQRVAILKVITREFAPNRDVLDDAISAMRAADTNAELSRAEAQLRIALDAPRANFFKQFNLLPDGVKFLVDLRADLLAALPQEPALEVLKIELDGLLESWFDPGFLELQRISWQSPALVLEKLIAYEAVHPIGSWGDLRNRLDTDRRCYAFFHPRLPNEPLIFVEIALDRGLPASVQILLDQNAPVRDPATSNTAVFYSISNTQKGLRGISFGNLLLKRVIEDLRGNLPGLKVFATLSPLPGFRKWLDQALADRRVVLPVAEAAKFAAALGHPDPGSALADALARPEWPTDPRFSAPLREPMEKVCARYLLEQKSDGQPLDAVAQFHLNNGAQVSRLYWLADTSSRGMRQSYGMMVSYRYDPDKVDENHQRFLHDGHIVAARRVSRLLG